MENVEITQEQYEKALKTIEEKMVKMPDGSFRVARDERMADGRWVKYEIKCHSDEMLIQKATDYDLMLPHIKGGARGVGLAEER